MRYLVLTLIGITLYFACGLVAVLLCLAVPRKFHSKVAILSTCDLQAMFWWAPLTLLVALGMWIYVLVHYPCKRFADWVIHTSETKLNL